MAENDNQLYLTLCKLQELFKGRYSVEEVATILGHNEGHLDRSVQFILGKEPEEIRRLLETERNSWTTIETKTRRIKNEHRLALVRPSILERAKSGCIDTSARLFACKPCDSSWWRRTPQRKEVARCKKCRVRYNPVPRDKEWGWAEFKCHFNGCGREFGGWCAMNMTSPCFGCRRPLPPVRVLPPNKRQDQPRGRRSAHSCDAEDCVSRVRTGGGYYTGGNTYCVHPSSRLARGLPRVITPSEPHDSTGSTVETFLSQTDMTKDQEIFYPSLGTVQEEDDNHSLGGNPGSDDGGEGGEGGDGHPPGPVGQARPKGTGGPGVGHGQS